MVQELIRSLFVCIVHVFVNINNEELFGLCYFLIGLDEVRSTGNMSSINSGVLLVN